MKAMILAAGFGTRLWPLTVGRTKPALPFLNRPLIAFTIDYLRRYGFEDVIINLHHEPESVRQQIGDGSRFGVHIHYSVEAPEILGTSGALDNVRELLS
nr:sugar phosphate nucleotidyltransferase [Acidobacteriota bacterium]